MNKIITVTVVTVCRNVLESLKKTVDSVLVQKYDRLDYVIIDGASSDGTLQYLESISDSRVRFVSEPDKGIYDAMNKGIGLAQGEFVIFMNAGDTFFSDDVIGRFFPTYSDSDVVYGSVVKNGIVKPAENPHNGHRMYFCHQCVFTRIECLKQFPFDISHRMSADFKQFKQLFKAGAKFTRTDIPVADFDTSGVSNVQRSKGLADNISVIKETDSFFDRLKLLPRISFTYYICRLRNK